MSFKGVDLDKEIRDLEELSHLLVKYFYISDMKNLVDLLLETTPFCKDVAIIISRLAFQPSAIPLLKI